MIPVHPVNNQSMLGQKLDIMKRKTREPTKADWMENTGQRPSRGDVQVRVEARSLILGLIWKKFLTDNNQVFKKRVMRTQNQDSLRSSILSHLENWTHRHRDHRAVLWDSEAGRDLSSEKLS